MSMFRIKKYIYNDKIVSALMYVCKHVIVKVCLCVSVCVCILVGMCIYMFKHAYCMYLYTCLCG